MITAEHIVKSYRGERALRDVSLHVSEGEFVVILGASGSGKSTLLNVLSGLERADSGTVTFRGEKLGDMTDRDLTRFRAREVGFVFQQYYLLPHLSVEGNVKLGADLVHNRDYRAVIEAVGLGSKRLKKPSSLSGGEQQRVCIARALAKNPSVLFLDEPTGALDENTGREILGYISALQKERKFTMIMVTHNENIAHMAQTVVKMNSGKISNVMKNEAPMSAYEIGW